MIKKFSALVFLITVGLVTPNCGPVENSSALDEVLYGPSIDLSDASPEFAAVRTALTKCQNCHGSWLSMTEDQFISLGLVIAGNPSGSKLYYRNQGATSGPGPKNMPSGGFPALSSAELQSIIDWISIL